MSILVLYLKLPQKLYCLRVPSLKSLIEDVIELPRKQIRDRVLDFALPRKSLAEVLVLSYVYVSSHGPPVWVPMVDPSIKYQNSKDPQWWRTPRNETIVLCGIVFAKWYRVLLMNEAGRW